MGFGILNGTFSKYESFEENILFIEATLYNVQHRPGIPPDNHLLKIGALISGP